MEELKTSAAGERDLSTVVLDLNEFGASVWQTEGSASAASLPELAAAVVAVGSAHAALAVERVRGGKTQVTGRVAGSVTLNCARCLSLFDLRLEADFERLYGIGEDPANLEPEREMVEDIDYLPDGLFSLTRLIEEELLLLLPMIPRCNEACQGLCAGCGVNLNRKVCACPPKAFDGPFAGLKVLKK